MVILFPRLLYLETREKETTCPMAEHKKGDFMKKLVFSLSDCYHFYKENYSGGINWTFFPSWAAT
jgi:hypothetical protein